MIRAAVFASLIFVAAPAVAQAPSPRTVPTLRAAVTVTSDLVRIGDLIDNAGVVASIPVFRSPDYGTTGSVTTSQVLDALRLHNLFLIDTQNIAEVAVTRIGRPIGSREIEEKIARAFAGRFNYGDAKSLTVVLDRDVRPIVIDPAVTTDLMVVRSTIEPRSGRFDIVIEIPTASGGRGPQQRYTGTLTETVEVAVLTRVVGRGEIVRNSDIALEKKPRADLPGEVIGSVDEAVGRAARQTLRAGAVIRRTDLVKPELVRRDETVTIVYEAPGLMLTMRGKALDSGAEGDLISVMNVQSKRPVQGYVTGPGRVTIPGATGGPTTTGSLASNTYAANTAAGERSARPMSE
jgi:flagella basal body P-ring formation protein FlgA